MHGNDPRLDLEHGDGGKDAANNADSSLDQVDADTGEAGNESDVFHEGLVEEISNLVDDGVTYAQAELSFQKTRAKIAGRSIGIAAACIAVALILLHIALLALAVGLVIALQPLATIWGAIAIVVGVILALAVYLLLKARSSAARLGDLFGSDDDA